MCPISGLVQFLVVIVALLLICQAVFVSAGKVIFDRKNVTVTMYDSVQVNYKYEGDQLTTDKFCKMYVENENIATVDKEIYISNTNLYGTLNITGNFLGLTQVYCKNSENADTVPSTLDVIVVRKMRVIDRVFTASVITLVSIIYINFGCALNWDELKTNLKRPIGPVIGFVGQFLLMPLLSFGLGKALFPDNPEMQLGMFFTGVSPAGGASNVWTAVLEGNIDLSVTMTTISTFAAFAMMPLWIFTLGKLIFDNGRLAVPYVSITEYAAALVIPLGIGFLIQRYCKKVSHFLVRILKGFSALLILFIIIFAIVTNMYIFQLFSWQIVVAGMGLPYLGYILAYILAKVLKQSPPDALAIAIETGIQNTGIAIFLLKFTLLQPEADLTTVAPVAVAIMTPIPLIALFMYKKIIARLSSNKPHRKLRDVPIGKIDMDNNVDNTGVYTI